MIHEGSDSQEMLFAKYNDEKLRAELRIWVTKKLKIDENWWTWLKTHGILTGSSMLAMAHRTDWRRDIDILTVGSSFEGAMCAFNMTEFRNPKLTYNHYKGPTDNARDLSYRGHIGVDVVSKKVYLNGCDDNVDVLNLIRIPFNETKERTNKAGQHHNPPTEENKLLLGANERLPDKILHDYICHAFDMNFLCKLKRAFPP